MQAPATVHRRSVRIQAFGADNPGHYRYYRKWRPKSGTARQTHIRSGRRWLIVHHKTK